MHKLLPLILLLSSFACVGPLLVSAEAGQAQTAANFSAEKAQLRLSFESRKDQLRALKDAGQVGETTAGLLAIPTGTGPDEAGNNVIESENTDRRRLYELLGNETGGGSDQVAERNARRNYDQAKTGDWLQKRDGTWAKKQ